PRFHTQRCGSSARQGRTLIWPHPVSKCPSVGHRQNRGRLPKRKAQDSIQSFLFSYHRPNWDSYLSSIFLFYWEIIDDNLSKTGWSWGCVSAVDSKGRTIWIVDAHRDGKRFVVRADQKLIAFLELERAICVSLLTEQV